MAGDIVTLKDTKTKASVDGVGGKPVQGITGAKSSFFYNEAIDGTPRHEDLFAVRLLGRTGYIEMAKDIIKDQVSSTDFRVKPVIPENEDREPTDREREAANEMTQFLKGQFNTDDEAFSHLLKAILNDVLDFNSGIVELVPDDDGYLKELIIRDGLTFTKNELETGKLPAPSSDEPAYYQFSLSAQAKQLFSSERQGIDLQKISNELNRLGLNRVFQNKKKRKFSRNQIAWFEMDGRSETTYGRGKTQKVKKQAEHLINGDLHRNRFFLEDEYQKGFIKVPEDVPQSVKDSIEDRFKDSAGNQHEMRVIGTEGAEYVSIDPNPEQMQFLESHKWFNKLALSIYGLNANEAGFVEDSSRNVSEQQEKNVWNRTTKPFLEMLERVFTRQILPYMREFNAVDIDFKLEFEPQNDFLKRIQNDFIKQEQELGTMSLNEARMEKGKDGYGPLGELPKFAVESLASRHPGWTAEQMVEEIEDTPEDDPSGGLFEGLLNGNNNDNNSSDSKKKSNKEKEEGNGKSLQDITSYREAFKHTDKLLEQTKDALRNERGFNDVPGIVEHKNKMKNDVAQVFESINLESKLEEEFPQDEQENGVLVNADKIVDSINIRERLASVLETNNLGALEMSAEHFEQDIEKETEERLTLPSETKVELSFDVLDTFTADIIREQALDNATTIESSIKNQLKNQILKGAKEGEGIDKITDRILDTKDSITRNHAELVARTETLQSSRKGSQALAESTDLIGGKEWIATSDSRVRDWHSAMDGQIVPKDDHFVVPQTTDSDQPSDYPRNARVVGEDQPYNCRCSQAPVLSEDMPDSVQQLSELNGVTVDLGITKRQFEVWKQHGTEYDSFEKFWNKTTEENSVENILSEFGMSKTTYYNWKN